MKRRSRQRGRFGKEFVLLFLAGFYFLIATNTQSGWLFLLSAFLLGLLVFSWLPPRRAARTLALKREQLGSVQRDVPMTIRLTVSNLGTRTLREILVVESANAWSREDREFRWVIPTLPAGESVTAEYSLRPALRGEHSLASSSLRVGAPFGLFAVERQFPQGESFLVFPRLSTLGSARRQSRLAGILTEFVSPRSKGDSRSLRSLREYRSGDDLRMVHWKSSAKTGGSTLMVREYHAPSRQLGLLFLDTTRREEDPLGEECFESAVALTASLLWSAHRAGTASTLALRTDSGWSRLTRWEEQFQALARVQRGTEDMSQWLQAVEQAVAELPELRGGGVRPFLIVAANSAAELGPARSWEALGHTFLVTNAEATEFSDYPVRLVAADDDRSLEVFHDV